MCSGNTEIAIRPVHFSTSFCDESLAHHGEIFSIREGHLWKRNWSPICPLRRIIHVYILLLLVAVRVIKNMTQEKGFCVLIWDSIPWFCSENFCEILCSLILAVSLFCFRDWAMQVSLLQDFHLNFYFVFLLWILLLSAENLSLLFLTLYSLNVYCNTIKSISLLTFCIALSQWLFNCSQWASENVT